MTKQREIRNTMEELMGMIPGMTLGKVPEMDSEMHQEMDSEMIPEMGSAIPVPGIFIPLQP